jgi:hypothetical protein
MVFNEGGSNLHHKTNIRDRSTDPANIYGDANISNVRARRDLSDDDDMPPPLENIR